MTVGYPPHVVAKLDLPEPPPGHHWVVKPPNDWREISVALYREVETRVGWRGRQKIVSGEMVRRRASSEWAGRLRSEYTRLAHEILHEIRQVAARQAEVDELWAKP